MKIKGTSFRIFYLMFIMPASTWALGDWSLQLHNTNYGLYGVSFVDTLHGWAVGGGLDSGVVLRTNDGGENWDWIYKTGQELIGVSFVDTLYGWAVGDSGVIIHTNNGGENWVFQNIDTTAHFSRVAFMDRDTGWAVGPGTGIFHTTNGGNPWNKEFEYGGRDLSFVDAKTGWVAADDVLHISDTTLEIQEPGIPGSLKSCWGIFFIDTLNGWVTAWSYYNSAEWHWILHTEDGGETWEIQDSMLGNGPIYFIDSENGWTARAGGWDIYYTTNGGDTWNFHCNSPVPNYISDFFFTDINHGWATGWYPIVENRLEGSIIHYKDDQSVEESSQNDLLRKKFFKAYPNPIYQGVYFSFQTENSCYVTLKIYDISGRLVHTLIYGEKAPGYYTAKWDAEGFPTGVYFARFVAGDFIKTKKLVLMR